MKDSNKKLPPNPKDGPICTICLQGGHRADKCPQRRGKGSSGTRVRKGKQW